VKATEDHVEIDIFTLTKSYIVYLGKDLLRGRVLGVQSANIIGPLKAYAPSFLAD
jgi:hypothetical protein